MELIVRLGERAERVRVERVGERYEVEIGTRHFAVDSRSMGQFVRSLIVDGTQHEVSVFRVDAGRYAIGWDGRSDVVEVTDPLSHLAQQVAAGSQTHARRRVTAYMPGRVMTVLVAEGDTVVAGQGLVVLEAMKMQNEIQAERGGVVRAVAVAAGEAVDGGDLLVEIE
jgi:pyruvate carboxylase subunit B